LNLIGGFFSYVAPEYACTGMLNEKSDVYSFGILIMEIISGRNPVDYGRPQGEVSFGTFIFFSRIRFSIAPPNSKLNFNYI
jgi:serine/threonine protein kinase